MIELYSAGTTDYSKHGIALAARQASVTYQENGRFDMDLVMPYDPRIAVDYGMILRCPVPVQDVGEITLGEVEYWEVSSGLSDVPLYAQVPKKSKVSYANWEAYRSYMANDKVTYGEDEEDPKTLKNWRCTTGHGGLSTPPPQNPTLWTRISSTKTTSKTITTLDAGDIVIKTGDYNSTYMKVVDTAGHEGFIEIAKCTDRSETDTRTVPAQHIEKQSFVITEITKSSDGQTISIHAEHVSYELGRVMLGDCNISRATPSTALMIIRGAMQEDYPGEVETNLTGNDALITGDFSWKNAQASILDPKAGLLQATGAKLIRNDLNVYIIMESAAEERYRITYGANMKAVKWDGDVSGLVTRVYPVAQNEDGSTLLLPEIYIDTVRTVPYVRPEALQTGLKVGAKEEQEDGSEITLDTDTVYSRMREAAQNRFSVDEADKATVTLEVDWQHLPDTAEYAAYAALRNAAPGEWVLVKNGPLGIDTTIQLTGYTYDPILGRYNKGTFGKKKQGATVAGYEIQSGAVTGRAIARGAVGSQNIQANSITAREIEANSITADKIASRSIITELLAAGVITADEINAGAVTAVKIAANAITAEKIDAGAVTADKIAAGAVTADKIDAGAITADKIDANDISAINAKLGVADIAEAVVESADIGFAQIKALTAESLIAHDAVTDKYYINKLAVNSVQATQATVGELIVKASDNHYYRLDINAQEELVATDVTSTLTSSEIAAGVTSDGHSAIIETDLTVSDLSASNLKAINALIDKISASRIDVQELFARQATITQINSVDIRGNSYLQLYVGDTAYTKKSGIEISDNGIDISGGKFVRIKAGSGGTAAGKLIVESGNFTIDQNGNVTVNGTVTAGAGSVIGGWTLDANRIHSGTGSTYVALDSDTTGTYAIWAGNETASSAPFSVTRAGALKATSGTIGGWSISSSHIGNAATLNASTAGITNAANASDLVFWAGGEYNGTGANAPKFRVAKDGTVTLTALKTVGEGGTETEVNLRTAGLWKLGYVNLKDAAYDSGTQTLTLTRFTGGDVVVNFSGAGSVNLTGSWSGNVFTVEETNSGATRSETLTATTGTGTTLGTFNITSFNSSHKAYAQVGASSLSDPLFGFNIDATSEYNKAKPTSAVLGEHRTGTNYLVTVTQSDNNTVDLVVNLSAAYADARSGYTQGTFTLASVTLQGDSQSVYISASSGGYTYYRAGTAATYYKGDGARYSSATRYPAGTKGTYYRGNGSRLSAAIRYKAGTAATYYQGNGARYTSATRYHVAGQKTAVGTAVSYDYNGTLYDSNGNRIGNGYWFKRASSANLYTAGSSFDYVNSNSADTVLIASGTGTYYLRGDSVSVTAQGTAESVYVYDASGSYYLRGDSVEITPIGAAQTVLVSNSSGAYYLRGTSESVTKIDTSKKIEHLTQTTRYKAGSTVTNTYYTKS